MRDKSAFGVAAFGRKPPFEFPSQFAALCRDAATSEAAGIRLGLNNLPCSINRNPHQFHQSLLDVFRAD
jgi:hypothetical protein